MELAIEERNVFAHYDAVKRLAMLSFRNTFNAESIQLVETWLDSLNQPLLGILSDVKQVTRFPQGLPFTKYAVPLAFVVANPYQSQTLQKLVTHPETQHIADSHEEGILLFRGAVPSGSSANPFVLNSEGATVFYNQVEHIAYMIYYGTVTPNVTADVYATLNALIEHNNLSELRGGIFDFRFVAGFDHNNFTSVRRTSGKLNIEHDMSHVATALITGTIVQERMLMVSMKLTPQEKRKRLVRSFTEARQFIDDFEASRLANDEAVSG